MHKKPILAIVVILLVLLSLSCAKPQTNQRFKLFLQTPNNKGPDDNCKDKACLALLENIGKAKKRIDFAVYGFLNQPKILEALVAAKRRGVIIRGVVDKNINNENYYSDTDRYIEKIGNVGTDYKADLLESESSKNRRTSACERPKGTKGPVSCFKAYYKGREIFIAQATKDPIPFAGNIMHNKFFVFDDKKVWTGSSNISDKDIGGYNANASILINDKEIASWYKQEFETMYVLGLFHKKKEENVDYNGTHKKGPTIKMLFSPNKKVFKNSVLQLINGAKSKINISIFFLTNKKITKELINAKARGIDIRIIIDATAARNAYSKHDVLRSVGIPVKVENWGGKMHAKAASADGRNMVIGSTNWTAAAQWSNDENLLFFKNNYKLASQYDDWFENLWNRIPEEFLLKTPLPESLLSTGSCFDGIDNDFDKLVDQMDTNCKKAQPTKPRSINDCPKNAVIKGNISDNGYIYHMPDDKYYSKTNPELCFKSKEEAEISGFRAAKI